MQELTSQVEHCDYLEFRVRDIEDNFGYGVTIVVRDPNGLLSGSNTITVASDARDTGVTVNGSSSATGIGTKSGILEITYSGYNTFFIVDPSVTPSGGSTGATGVQGPTGPQGAIKVFKVQLVTRVIKVFKDQLVTRVIKVFKDQPVTQGNQGNQ